MIGGSLQGTIGQLRRMPAQQVAALTKDPTVGYLALTELRARNVARQRLQQVQSPPPATVADQDAAQAVIAENAGIMSGAPMGVPMQRFAQGGVVGYADGGDVELLAAAQRMATEQNIPLESALRFLKIQENIRSTGGRYVGKNVQPTPGMSVLMDYIPRMYSVGQLYDSPPGAATTNELPPFMPDDAALTPRADTTELPPKGETGDGAGGGVRGGGGAGGGAGGGVGIAGLAGRPTFNATLTQYITPEMVQTELAQRQALQKQLEANLYKAPTNEERRAAEQAEAEFQRKATPLDPAFAAAAERIQKRLADLEGSEQRNRRQGWIDAGLGMLANTSPFFGVGIGEGGLRGMKTYRELQSADQAALDKLTSAQLDVGKAKMAWERDTQRAGLESLARQQAAEAAQRAAVEKLIGVKREDSGLPRGIATAQQDALAKAAQAMYHQAHAESLPYQMENDAIRARAAMVSANAAAARNTIDKGHLDQMRKDTAFDKFMQQERANIAKLLETDGTLKVKLLGMAKGDPFRAQELMNAYVERTALARARNQFAWDKEMTNRISMMLDAFGGNAAAEAPQGSKLRSEGSVKGAVIGDRG